LPSDHSPTNRHAYPKSKSKRDRTQHAIGRAQDIRIEALAARDAIVVIPVASLENHEPHLATGVDIVLTKEIALRAAPRSHHGATGNPCLAMTF
jgi:creatinine amidohydrolase/Fe(II)-dependent formamide hydrolase-like protein